MGAKEELKVAERWSPVEQRVREELAATARALAELGWTKLIFNHITARIPDDPERFLINPYGLFYDQVRASDFVKIDYDGNLVGENKWEAGRAGFVIHSAVYRARPDVFATIHTHTDGGTIVSTLEEGLLPLTLEAAQFYGRVGYHSYEGMAHDTDERERIAEALGQHPALILRNHGLVVTGSTIAEAFHRNYNLEYACRIQAAALATGRPLTYISHEAATKTVQQVVGSPKRSEPLLEAIRRRLDQKDPSYRL
ncbi:class II aldolase/adducin family protein [Uliginosibacterium sp. H3]|uniref:Class II aldolase/adducin family protein n=1 Tax=Uliginosibacterium silvisoli TaxID=3114758 RepID=A0ABU6K4N8_9RHOO|nr:class II aldolase/adducin family protein [Uliginosibacterium sp. H3]